MPALIARSDSTFVAAGVLVGTGRRVKATRGVDVAGGGAEVSAMLATVPVAGVVGTIGPGGRVTGVVAGVAASVGDTTMICGATVGVSAGKTMLATLIPPATANISSEVERNRLACSRASRRVE